MAACGRLPIPDAGQRLSEHLSRHAKVRSRSHNRAQQSVDQTQHPPAIVFAKKSTKLETTATASGRSPVHDGEQLLSDVLRPPQAARLHEVFEAPGRAEVVCLPALIHGQQRQVVPLWLEELGLLLVRLGRKWTCKQRNSVQSLRVCTNKPS